MRARRGPGLVGTMARTAVVAGTATAVSGSMQRRAATRHMEQAELAQARAAQAAADEQARVDAAVAAALAAQGGATPAAATPASVAATPAASPAGPPGGDDVIARLQQLAELKAQGILTEEEFAAQKARILGG
jgi:type II secretory pathway pseudopilin PulG